MIINRYYLLLLRLAMVFISSGCVHQQNLSPSRSLPDFSAVEHTSPQAPLSTLIYEQSWAVVIGIDEYKYPWPKSKLSYAVNDAVALANALERLGFPRGNIFPPLLNEKASKIAIETRINQLQRMVGPRDRVLIFFAGHGIVKPLPRGKSEGFLLPYDVDINNPEQTAIPMSYIEQIGARMPARHVLFVLDACYSGFAALQRAAPTPQDISLEQLHRMADQSAVQILTAGTSGEEVKEKDGHGIFTARFIQGLELSTDKNQVLALPQLYGFVYDRVVKDTQGKQNPVSHTYAGEGQFIFRWPVISQSAHGMTTSIAQPRGHSIGAALLPDITTPVKTVNMTAAHFHVYRQVAEHPEAFAKMRAGVTYLLEGKNAREAEEGIRLIRQAAEQELPIAQALIGIILVGGGGELFELIAVNAESIPTNVTEGLDWIRRAAKQGDNVGQGFLGMAYLNGIGMKRKDEVTAAQWFHKSAEQGNVGAQNLLGEMYHRGVGVEPDQVEARKWFTIAAEGGFPNAQNNLGVMYANGWGGERDEPQAAFWFGQAAAQGHPDAQNNLGVMYANAWGIDRDESQAAFWFGQAAAQGHPDAQYNLGVMYANAWGIDRDESQAAFWFGQAAAQGHPDAQEWLRIRGLK